MIRKISIKSVFNRKKRRVGVISNYEIPGESRGVSNQPEAQVFPTPLSETPMPGQRKREEVPGLPPTPP